MTINVPKFASFVYDGYISDGLSRIFMADVVIVRECRHGQVRVLYGDIVGVEGDVMVIPANSRLAGREGLMRGCSRLLVRV